MNKEDERFAVEGNQVIDIDNGDQVVGTWPSHKDAQKSADRLNKRAQNAGR